jgi:hypothetical protein
MNLTKPEITVLEAQLWIINQPSCLSIYIAPLFITLRVCNQRYALNCNLKSVPPLQRTPQGSDWFSLPEYNTIIGNRLWGEVARGEWYDASGNYTRTDCLYWRHQRSIQCFIHLFFIIEGRTKKEFSKQLSSSNTTLRGQGHKIGKATSN